MPDPGFSFSSPQGAQMIGAGTSALNGLQNASMSGATQGAYFNALNANGPLSWQSQFTGAPGGYQPGINMLGSQANELSRMQVNPMTLAAARNAAAQGSAGQGLSGPLAASVQSGAENSAYSMWDQWRRQALMQTLGQQAGLQGQQQSAMQAAMQQQLAQRQQLAQQAAMKKQQDEAFWGMIGTVGGGLVGGGLTALTGGAAAPFLPLFMSGGGALGSGLAGAF